MALNSPVSHVTLTRPEIASRGLVRVTPPSCVEALSCRVALPGMVSAPSNSGAGHRSASTLSIPPANISSATRATVQVVFMRRQEPLLDRVATPGRRENDDL